MLADGMEMELSSSQTTWRLLIWYFWILIRSLRKIYQKNKVPVCLTSIWKKYGTTLLMNYISCSFRWNFCKLNPWCSTDQYFHAFIGLTQWKQYVRTNFAQSKWFLASELPSFADYLSNGLITTAYYPLASAAFMGMDSATKDVMDWMPTHPKLFVALGKHTRLLNDVGSYKVWICFGI